MDVQIPVYLYDVVTTADTPRVVVTCRTVAAQSDLVARLNSMAAGAALAGDEAFAPAAPRVATVTMPVIDGSSVSVQGFDVAIGALAQLLPPLPAPVSP